MKRRNSIWKTSQKTVDSSLILREIETLVAGRSSDSFLFRCLPGMNPVAKSIGTDLPPRRGRNLQQRELLPTFTAFPINSSYRIDGRCGNL